MGSDEAILHFPPDPFERGVAPSPEVPWALLGAPHGPSKTWVVPSKPTMVLVCETLYFSWFASGAWYRVGRIMGTAEPQEVGGGALGIVGPDRPFNHEMRHRR